jgi:hypothetical protein
VRKIREDPFARLENEVQDVAKGEEEKPRLQEIIEMQVRNQYENKKQYVE